MRKALYLSFLLFYGYAGFAQDFPVTPPPPPRNSVLQVLQTLTPSRRGTTKSVVGENGPSSLPLSLRAVRIQRNAAGTEGNICTDDPDSCLGFRVLESLGKGSYGEVRQWEFTASDESTDESTVSLAVKSSLSSGASVNENTKLIIMKLRNLHYSDLLGRVYVNIPTHIFVLEDESGPPSPPFIGLPYARHGDLSRYKARIKREGKQLSLQEIIRVLCQVILGLDALHSEKCGIIHHDIKPENILISKVTSEGKIVEISITDHDRGCPTSEIKQKKNQGTVKYMAPEKISNDSNTPEVDLFSVGITGLSLMDEDDIFYQETDGEILIFQVARMYRARFFTPYETALGERIKEAATEEERHRLAFIAEYILPLVDPTPTVRSEAALRLVEDHFSSAATSTP